jgi:hypothetical protein
MMIWRIAKWIGLVFVGLFAACGATPLPDPPDLDPPDRDAIEGEETTNVAPPPMPTATIYGDSGTTVPGTVIHAVVLDGDLPPRLAVADESGGFAFQVDGAAGNEVRLTYRRGDARSEPLDGIVPSMSRGPLEPATRDACVVLPATLDLGEVTAGESVTLPILVENDCAAEIPIAVRMRARSAVLSIAAPETSIAAGESSMLEATFAPVLAGAFEEVAFLDVGAARYPITLFGTAVE